MIKDVKDYFNNVGSRLSKVFSIENFGTEEELEFWSLSAEHMSRKEAPSFPDIAKWVDLLYKAPLHFVYKKVNNDLILIRRHLFTHNLLKKEEREAELLKYSVKQKEFIQDFENQMLNIQKKREWDEDFLSHGVSSHTIGNCEHIPIYKKDGEIWGVYIVGPFIKSPDDIVPKLSIVGRILSIWLQELDSEDRQSQRDYESRVMQTVSKLGTGALNTEGISRIMLLYLTNSLNASSGAIVEKIGGRHVILAEKDLSKEHSKVIVSGQTPDDSDFIIPFKSSVSEGYVWLDKKGDTKDLISETLFKSYSNTFNELLSYREENNRFTDGLIDTYYKMIRELEGKRDKTKYHTPRMMAFVERFGMFFGLEDEEIERIKLTAKLHDIGYVGATGISDTVTVGSELAHPLTGAVMLEELPIHKDVVEGVRTHHEWVNGQGNPNGLTGEEIPWTGKIIGVFEYVIDFIENHFNDNPSDAEKLLELLNNSLIERADKQFDMVLIPTVIQLLQMQGWEACVKLGTEDA